jgi:DNA-binding protein HU-beta
MTKVDLAEIIALEHRISKAQAMRIVETFIFVARETVAAGDTLSLRGLGTFRAVQAGARVGLNPRTGERVAIEAVRRPKFLAGRALRKAVRLGNAHKNSEEVAHQAFSCHANARKI